MRKLMAWGVGLSVSAFALGASAEEAGEGGREFGNAGVLAFSAATSLDLSIVSIKSPTGDSSSETHFSISPSIDYFVIDGLSVGGVLGFALDSSKPPGATDSGKATTITIGPRVGYNIWLTPPSLSLWPQVGILYSHLSTSSGGVAGASGSKVSLDVGVPLLIHPVKHFHFGIGPFVTLDLSSSSSQSAGGASADGNKATVFGLRGEIAGWL